MDTFRNLETQASLLANTRTFKRHQNTLVIGRTARSELAMGLCFRWGKRREAGGEVAFQSEHFQIRDHHSNEPSSSACGSQLLLRSSQKGVRPGTGQAAHSVSVLCRLCLCGQASAVPTQARS